jgi:F-box interacting protein
MASSGRKRRDQNSFVHEPLLPTLPSDVIPEILCRLPVKFLLRFRCVSKSWKSLISDPKFIKKQLCVSATRNVHFLEYTHESGRYILTSYPLDSIFTNITSNFTRCTQSEYYSNHFDGDCFYGSFYCFIGSCNGIVCIADDHKGLVILWNPSTRKFKELPIFEKPYLFHQTHLMTFGFGYDSSKNNYKVVVVLLYEGALGEETQVKVHTLGTNIWRTIQKYPFSGVYVPVMKGEFVSGKINWLFSKESEWAYPRFIVSFDLAKESFQKISPPNLGGTDVCDLSALGVLRDCLCVTTSSGDIWIMKEYGNKELHERSF